MTNPNRCPICRCAINHAFLMCGKHWGLVPLGLRTKILGLYRNAPGSDLHRSACFEAIHLVSRLLHPVQPTPPRAA